jgi:hypothetical protein
MRGIRDGKESSALLHISVDLSTEIVALSTRRRTYKQAYSNGSGALHNPRRQGAQSRIGLSTRTVHKHGGRARGSAAMRPGSQPTAGATGREPTVAVMLAARARCG